MGAHALEPFGHTSAVNHKQRRTAKVPPRRQNKILAGVKEALALAQGHKNPASVTFWLSLPPSANMRLGYGRGRVYRTKRYKDWLIEAGWELTIAKLPRIRGRFAFRMDIADNAPLDADNAPKCVLDLLQAHRIIENDRLATEARPVRDVSVPPGSCRITLTPVEASASSGRAA